MMKQVDKRKGGRRAHAGAGAGAWRGPNLALIWLLCTYRDHFSVLRPPQEQSVTVTVTVIYSHTVVLDTSGTLVLLSAISELL